MVESRVGRYVVIRELGRGGMAVVYLALDPNVNRQVALKMLPRQFTSDTQFLARFRREAQVIAALEHPAIVPVYDFGEHDGQPFIVMRYMPGGSLAERLGSGPLPLAETARVFDRLAPGLDSAHSKGIVHRDLKPANILFDEWQEPYLSDFGIAKIVEGDATALTLSGGIVGTPGYMSPEQVLGEIELDSRSDIYSLGVILFQVLTGRLPYQANTPMALALMHVNEPIPDIRAVNPAAPEGSQELINRALAKDREDRYPTATQLAEAVGTQLPSHPRQIPDQTVIEPSPMVDTVKDDAAKAEPATTVQVKRRQERGQGRVALPAQLKRLPAWSWVIIILVPLALLTLWLAIRGGTGTQEEIAAFNVTVTAQMLALEATLTVPPSAEPASTAGRQPTESAAASTLSRPSSTPNRTSTATPGATPSVTPSRSSTPTPTIDPNEPPPNAQLGDTWTRPLDGMEMVYVPPPEVPFVLASGLDAPQEGYWIDKYEVSNAQYQLCMDSGTCQPSGYGDEEEFNGADYPVVGVSWYDAGAYSAWVDGELPTEGEWEFAAVGDSGMNFPWGDNFDGTRLNYCDVNCSLEWKDESWDDGYTFTAPVGSYPAGESWVGAVDMAGNVWEWTASLWNENSEGRVLRGGSWGLNRDYARAASRNYYAPLYRNGDFGFRVVHHLPSQ